MTERQVAQGASLPAGWEQISVGQLLEAIETGKSFTADSSPPDLNQVGVMKVSAVTWGVYDETESKTVHDPAQVNPKFFVKPGDLLFSRANTIDLVGAVVLVDHVTRDVMLSDKILRFCMPQEFKKWTLWCLRSQLGRRQIEMLATGNQESMRNIGQDRIRQIVLPLPPQHERDRIVSAIETQFSRLDDAVASLKRAKANVKRARASVLNAAVEGRLVPTEAALARAEGRDYEPVSVLRSRILTERHAHWEASGAKGKYDEPVKPAEASTPLPEGWAWVTIEQLASEQSRSIQSGPFGSSLLHSEFQTTGRLVIGIDNVQDGYFSPGAQNRIAEEKYQQLSKYAARPCDLAITVMATIGRCCVIPANIEPSIITKHVYRITLDPRLSVPEYVMAAIRSPWGRANILMESKGQTRPGLNGTIIRAFTLPLPPVAEQRRIVAEVDRRLSVLDAIDANLDANLARCAKLRQAILKRAFEGRLIRPCAPGSPAPQLPLFVTEETAP